METAPSSDVFQPGDARRWGWPAASAVRARGIVLFAILLLGAILGVLALHPFTMAVYWFEFHPQSAESPTVWHFIWVRLGAVLTRDMLPMSAIFAAVGAGHAYVTFAVVATVTARQRVVTVLERALMRDLGTLLASGESETLEFKAAARWDLHAKRVNHALEGAIVKSIAGFLNHRGGSLLIGVDDAGRAVGLVNDFATLRRQNRDGFEQFLMALFESTMGAHVGALAHVTFGQVGGLDVCRVDVAPSQRPVYVRQQGVAHYYARTGNSTRELDVAAALEHIATRATDPWPPA